MIPTDIMKIILDYKSDLEHVERMERVLSELYITGFLTKTPFLMRSIWWEIRFY